jgi:hypothetical protein
MPVLTPPLHHRACYVQKQQATASREFSSHKRFPKRQVTLGNTFWGIVAPRSQVRSPSVTLPFAEGTQPLVFIAEGRGRGKLVNILPTLDGRIPENI